MKITIRVMLMLFCITTYSQTTVTNDYEYDNLNRLIKVVTNGDKETNYVYDDLGNRIGLNIKLIY